MSGVFRVPLFRRGEDLQRIAGVSSIAESAMLAL
jgi:hypothetical protein